MERREARLLRFAESEKKILIADNKTRKEKNHLVNAEIQTLTQQLLLKKREADFLQASSKYREERLVSASETARQMHLSLRKEAEEYDDRT